MNWSIFYTDGSRVDGRTLEFWIQSRSEEVQVIRIPEPYPEGRRPWRGVDDRQLWTGEDVYDPASPSARRSIPSLPEDWPPKNGSLISDEEYERIWWEAAHGPL